MYADVYKDFIESILIILPDEDLTKNVFITDKNGSTRLDPKYILENVPLEDNHHISN